MKEVVKSRAEYAARIRSLAYIYLYGKHGSARAARIALMRAEIAANYAAILDEISAVGRRDETRPHPSLDDLLLDRAQAIMGYAVKRRVVDGYAPDKITALTQVEEEQMGVPRRVSRGTIEAALDPARAKTAVHAIVAGDYHAARAEQAAALDPAAQDPVLRDAKAHYRRVVGEIVSKWYADLTPTKRRAVDALIASTLPVEDITRRPRAEDTAAWRRLHNAAVDLRRVFPHGEDLTSGEILDLVRRYAPRAA